jgi:hypothetical protein
MYSTRRTKIPLGFLARKLFNNNVSSAEILSHSVRCGSDHELWASVEIGRDVSVDINSMERRASWEVTSHSFKKFPAFYGTRNFITVYTKARTSLRPCLLFRNILVFTMKSWKPLRPTSKQEDGPLSAVRDCLFNIFAVTFSILRPSPPSATWGCAMPLLQRPT